MKTKLLIIALSILSLNSYSQIKFEAGYFIKNTGERIDCLIRNVDWKNNPTKFKYKLSEEAESITAVIDDVREFSVTDHIKYERFTVNIDRTSDLTSELREVRDPKFVEEKLFLRFLVEGEASLYKYEDGNLIRFFFKMDNSDVEQLVYLKYKSVKDDNFFNVKYKRTRPKIKENNLFKSQIFENLKCDQLSFSNIENLQYKENELVTYFVKFNSCKGVAFNKFEKEYGKDMFNIVLRPRANFYSFSYEGAGAVDFGSEVVPGFGVEFEIILPFNNNKWSLFIEPSYEYFKSDVMPTDARIRRMDYAAVEIPVGIRHYFFLGPKSKLFLAGGVAFGKDFNSKIDYLRTDITPNALISDLEIDGTQEFFFMAFGYNFNNRVSIEFRQNSNRNLLSNYQTRISDFKGYSIIVGYNIL
ncbi:MAG: tRNA modification GTPase [Flavobacteriaceae bacterium]|nr:MAG: tRNA modification GTPase [Flavobacteriaceae bacterium]